MNRSDMNWRVIFLSMACRFSAIIRKYNAVETDAPQYYIIDDTTIEKTGFHIEGISPVFDHVKHCCVPDFKLLVLAIFNERSTYTCDMSLHRENGKRQDRGLSEKAQKMQHRKQSNSKPYPCSTTIKMSKQQRKKQRNP